MVNRDYNIGSEYPVDMSLGETVRRLRKAKGMTQAQLSAAVRKRGGDLSQPQLSAIEKDEVENPGALVELAAELGVTAESLKTSALDKLSGTVPQPIEPLPVEEGRRDIPVWASIEGGQDGAMILTESPIEYITRSERMASVRNPFSFYVLGGSMSPAIDHGDQVVVNPNIPVKTGKDCVFIQTAEDGSMLGMVKRLLRSTGDAWKVRQFSPERDFELSKKKWTKAFVITEIRRG